MKTPVALRAVLAELVGRPSVNPDGDAGNSRAGEKDIADWVASYLRGIGAAVEMRPLAPDRPNVVAVFEPIGKPVATVAFVPHLDTVGVTGMVVPPFALTPRAGRLFGRGACDTKGPMAAILWALRRWARSAACRRNRVRWVVAATAGEEQGSLGAEKLLSGGFDADFAIALEPTALRVVFGAKGILRVWIESRGRAAHGSNPAKGDNAVYRLLPLALALRDEAAPALAGRRHPLLGPASLNLGVMEGGRELNVVPDACRLGLDIRHHPGISSGEVLRLLEALRDRHEPGARLTVVRSGRPFVTDRRNDWARRLRRAGRGWATADWFCDANVFAAAEIPAVAFGPGSIAQAHTRDEYIEAAELSSGADAFYRFLTDDSRSASAVSAFKPRQRSSTRR